MEVCGHLYAPTALSPGRVLGTHWVGLAHIVGLKVLEVKKIYLCLARNRTMIPRRQLGNIEVVTKRNFLHDKSHI